MNLYIHIPFCRSRCIYCDFYSQTNLALREAYTEAVCREIHERLHEPPATIYLGGGTPSQLTTSQLQRIFQAIADAAPPYTDAEITLEANPDDLSPARIDELRTLPINRLSLGIQTFDNPRLRFLHRRHTAEQAIAAVHDCHKAGFTNLSIDLIFGFPGQTLKEWESDLDQALALPVTHLSAYALSYEDGTPLSRMAQRGEVEEADEMESVNMYNLLCEKLSAHGFRHYEISNFCRPGFHSRHNCAYWTETPYLGIGAGAHSYDGHTRSWHPDSITAYIKDVRAREEEALTPSQRFDERILTRLRTAEGLDLPRVEADFGKEWLDDLLRQARPHLQARRLHLSPDGRQLTLTRAGILVSNDILSDLMRG